MAWARWELLVAFVGVVEPARADEGKTSKLSHRYIQGGVGIAGEFTVAPGAICSSVSAACILGSGAGIVGRGGIRTSGPFYWGFAYEFSKQDPSQIYRLAILQQARGEGRFYFLDTERDTQPYFVGTAGVAAYGNEWKIDTGGPAVGIGIGTETQISKNTLFGVVVVYRALYTTRFQDSAGSLRTDGIAQMIGIDVVLEGRDPF